MTLKEFMGITNPRLTNKQVAVIVWFGISAVIATLAVCIAPALPFWAECITIAVAGINLLASASTLPSSRVNIKE